MCYLCSLQRENENLVGKHSKRSSELQSEMINLPDVVPVSKNLISDQFKSAFFNDINQSVIQGVAVLEKPESPGKVWYFKERYRRTPGNLTPDPKKLKNPAFLHHF